MLSEHEPLLNPISRYRTPGHYAKVISLITRSTSILPDRCESGYSISYMPAQQDCRHFWRQ